MKRTKNKDASYTIEELFKRSSQQSSQIRRDQQDDQENNDDLLLALQLSKQEQVNEQRRLLEQFSQMSQQTIVASTVTKKKKRLIQPPLREEEEEEEDDDDQWFQTVSVRPQPVHKILKQKKKRAENKKKDPSKSTLKQAKDIVKTEKDSNEIVLDIDDMSEWLEAKEEPKVEDNFVIEDMSEWLKAKEEPEVEDNLVIDDLSAFLNQDDATSASILIDDEEKVPCPICHQLFKQGKRLENHAAMCSSVVISDSDTDCSIIDLVNNNSEVTGRQEEEDIIDPMRIDQEEEDGYLSPLEGYTNLRDNQDNQEFNQYFAQLEQAPVQSKKRSYTRNTTRNTTRKRKFYKKRKKDILKSTKSKA